ncbi:LPXTG cell wall anchor domain-containing protein [Micromonospora sp. NPDC049891]|uniref:LPXTG cell wall anchor domain-containing protein n=1 Tax=Micromonospora sp. NPDC049891 TaxID=3155655 RepID=UPI0033F5F2DF
MTTPRSALLAVSAALLAAGLAAAPASAAPAPQASDSAKLAAGTEQLPPTDGRRGYRVGQGEDVPALIGVTNKGDAPVNGVVVHIRILNDLDFTKTYENCWYAVDSNLESAWCEFDVELAPGASLAALGAGISTKPEAQPENISSIIHFWRSTEYVDRLGGIQKLADGWAGQGTSAVRGTGGPLTLATPAAPLVGLEPPNPLGFIGVVLKTSPTPTPTATPTATPTTTPTATPTGTPTDVPPASPGAPGDDDGQGGGLPVTGAQTGTLAAVGGVLLLLGGAAYLLARRRRTRFVA